MEETARDAAIQACTEHLRAIHHALDRYQHDHRELPPHLSDLYPDYLADEQLLHCPADASPGSPRFAGVADPRMAISYLYPLTTDEWPFPLEELGPRRPEANASWREVNTLRRTHYGDRVPAVRCWHHEPVVLNLTLAGEVYRSAGNWTQAPGTVAVMLDRMDQDLTAGPETFAQNWVPDEIDENALDWIDTALPPALRYRLLVLADKLSTVADSLPAAIQSGAYTLAARFYRGAGQSRKAIAAAEEALRHPGDHARVTFLLADLRYRRGHRRGAPPVDAYLQAEIARQHIPGLAVAVVRNGQVILARGSGLANVELGVAATPESVFGIMSVTKSLVATTLMMLVEQGQLALEEKISHYLSDLPDAWEEVTVRHLLTHTSGIRDYLNELPWCSREQRQEMTPADLVRRVSGMPPKFPPGEQWSYNNTGYVLLGMLIQEVSGKRWSEFLDEQVFQPLQMSTTRLNNDRVLIRNRAGCYRWENDSLRHGDPQDPTWTDAAGALVSTVLDLAKWDAALDSQALLNKKSLERMWTPAKLNDGATARCGEGGYGLGWQLESFRGHRIVGHCGGGVPGWSSRISRYVDERLTVILLANRDGLQSVYGGSLVNAIAAFYLPPPDPIEDKEEPG
jgi:D-alanyl-D-alanine carboxypeptidase